ncbi:hypothetical protein QQS21_011854 [Conoideocrella luteorostrata]|uniref:NACHT domain-containing protein n=1 Tax=Conoideocrella luteorostrata TaxID=1105319 RepID=A0AAJ0CF22_9HYPO|nr:hypothetical protein QQS21_011854 [Conoideocrella luteorostrata]
MTPTVQLSDPKQYTIGWITALERELTAAIAVLDDEHETPLNFTKHEKDRNSYTWGRIKGHNIVVASLAAGRYGTVSAASTAWSMISSLPHIRFGLLVGIGAGVPRPNHDIRLGDVVVSHPAGTSAGVVQYDLGKQRSDGTFERVGQLDSPPEILLKRLQVLKANYQLNRSRMPAILAKMVNDYPVLCEEQDGDAAFVHQGSNNDRLFQPSSVHKAAELVGNKAVGQDRVCVHCDETKEITRSDRRTPLPRIHYGVIASGNSVVKDGISREQILQRLDDNCICFEMEAAGLMNSLPCLVIREICDYVDAHKNDRWQNYAAATAAAFANELLEGLDTVDVGRTPEIREALNELQAQMNHMQQTAIVTEAATRSIRSDLRTDMIKRWLCPPDPSVNANHARTLRHEGTGTWLLESPILQEWHLGSRRHLWLNGLAGCGKTVLSVTLLDYLAKKNDRLVLSFFFNFNDTAKQTLDGMLRSLAFQLYQHETGSAGPLDVLFHAHQDGRNQPATETLGNVVCDMLAIREKVVIVLDAIDESTTRRELLLWITALASNADLSHTQLICTGRPEHEFLRDIPSAIGKENCLPLNKKSVNADIRSYVAAQLSERADFRRKHLSHDLLGGIQRQVGDGADGMFRWAFCQLDSLARCPHEAAIETALASLPRNLEETYKRMVDSIPRDRETDAMRLLQFIVHAKRPLSVAQAKEVIATQIEHEPRGFNTKRRLFSEEEILAYCPGLLTVVDAEETELHLAHFSVKEYLLGKDQFEIKTASISITVTCLTYLTDINGSYYEMERNFPAAMLTAAIWTGHSALAQASKDVVRATAEFLLRKETFERWTELYHSDYHWLECPSPTPLGPILYYACFSGLTGTARLLINKGFDVNAQGGAYSNALQAASYGGHLETVQMLLDEGADVNAQGGVYSNALQAASNGGYLETVRMLLNKGADVDAQGGRFSNALQAASAKGCLEIVKLLLSKGANVNAQGGGHDNALQAASARGSLEIIKLLLGDGADVNAKGGEYGSALQAASYHGHLEIVELLLGDGADVNAKGGEYGNALQVASTMGHLEIVKLLLDKRADVNAQGGYYSSALQAASAEGHLEIVKLLQETMGPWKTDVDSTQSKNVKRKRDAFHKDLDGRFHEDTDSEEQGSAGSIGHRRL